MIKYGFFNSVSGDRTYNADDVSNFFKGVLSDGIFKSYANELKVVPTGGMSVNVLSGKALINSKYLENNDQVLIEIEEELESTRYDIIIAFCDIEQRLCGIMVAPDNTQQTNTFKFITLARIRIMPGDTEILSSSITDYRSQNYVNLTALQTDIEGIFYHGNVYDNNFDSSEQKYYLDITYSGYNPATCTGLSVYLNGSKLRDDSYYYGTSGNNKRIYFTITESLSYVFNISNPALSIVYVEIFFIKNNEAYNS